MECVPHFIYINSPTPTDGPDVYVDMEPGVAEEEEEDGPFMGPYASSNLLSSRPDLKT